MGVVTLAALLGALTWSFLEYVIHRWAGHGPRAGRNVFGIEHLRHHVEGHYFAPTWKKAAAAAVAVAVFAWPAVHVAGLLAGGGWLAGFVGFYLTYEWLHRRAHTHAPKTRYGAFIRRHHFHHHFVDARTNHGVTSPMWDVAWRTLRLPAGPIPVPGKLAMPWLLDPATGEVRAPWREHYMLRGRKER